MRRYRQLALVLATVMTILAGTIATVSADKAYHSERLDLVLTEEGAAADHPVLRHGQVVNIHPNGPQNAALEKYMVSGAKANTGYVVVLHVQGGGCDGALLFSLETATIETNGAGSGHASIGFTPGDLAGLSGQTVGASWTLRSDGVDAYATECTTVVLD